MKEYIVIIGGLVIIISFVLALIFKSDFRKDFLVNGQDANNEASFFGIKIKGAVIFAIYGSTLLAFVYLFLNLEGNSGKINCNEPENWVALNLSKEEPARVRYATSTDTIEKAFSGDRLDLHFTMDSTFRVMSNKSRFTFGKLEDKSLMEQGMFNGLIFTDGFNLRFEIRLNPFESKIIQNTSKYSNSPFRLKIDYYRNNGKLYYQIRDLEDRVVCRDCSFEPGERENRIFRVGSCFYYLENTNTVLARDSALKYVDFRVITFKPQLESGSFKEL